MRPTPTKGFTGMIKIYSRNYNEDRVSIILNVIKPNSRKNEDWPKCSFFAIYDGHGGNRCADFLKENLHQYV
jgi:protein phosphatase 2C family protein 2/3